MRVLVLILSIGLAAPLLPARLHASPTDCPTGQCPLAAAGNPTIDARAIARIVNTRDAGRIAGTGTLVDVDGERGLIVTCAHLFREGVGGVSVAFPDCRSYRARLVKIDRAADLAALSISNPGIAPVAIAREYPQRGDPLLSCGYGSDGQLWCNRGQALGYVTTVGSHGFETLELSGAARFGDSGGPVLNGDHQLVAVLFGTNGRVVDGTFCGRVRRFLDDLSPRFRAGKPAAPATVPAVPSEAVASNGSLAQVPPPPALPAAEPPSMAPPPSAAPPPQRESESSDVSDPIGGAARSLETAAEPWLTAKLAALLVAWGVPGGIAGVAAGTIVWLVMRRAKSRLQEQLNRFKTGAAGQSLPPSTDPTTVDNSRLVERHHNRYVAYETTALDKAWATAHAHVGEKYPGAVPYLKMAEGVKDQLISGNTDPQLS